MAADAPLPHWSRQPLVFDPTPLQWTLGSDAVLLHLKGKKNPLYAGLTIFSRTEVYHLRNNSVHWG
eukprot:COSAG05_NODE_3573_length_1984_cov_2.962334_2_plen_66_part_00